MVCNCEPDGVNVGELGICRSALTISYEGFNGISSARRYIRRLVGTYCNGENQGWFA